MRRIYILLILSFIVPLAGGCGRAYSVSLQDYLSSQVPEQGLISGSELPEQLREVQIKIERGKNRSAGRGVKKWIKRNPESEYMDRALYLQSFAYLERKSYYSAMAALEDLLKEHAASIRFEDALYMQAELACRFLAGEKRKLWGFIPIGSKTEALAVLDRVTERWPGSELAGAAWMIQGDYYFYNEKYLEAQTSYQMVLDYYRNSHHYQRALLASADATYRQYNGSPYDNTCLTDAMIRYQQYQLSYPEHAAKIEIANQIAMIQLLQLVKEWDVADFYERTGKIGAARYYWSEISQSRPESEYAQQANEKLLETSEK